MEDLKFVEADGRWVASYVSGGQAVIHLEREKNSPVSIKASVADLAPVPIGAMDNPYSTCEIFAVDVPEGIKVLVESLTEVKRAKIVM